MVVTIGACRASSERVESGSSLKSRGEEGERVVERGRMVVMWGLSTCSFCSVCGIGHVLDILRSLVEAKARRKSEGEDVYAQGEGGGGRVGLVSLLFPPPATTSAATAANRSICRAVEDERRGGRRWRGERSKKDEEGEREGVAAAAVGAQPKDKGQLMLCAH